MAPQFTQLIPYTMVLLRLLISARMFLLELIAIFTPALLMTMSSLVKIVLFNKEPDWREDAKSLQTPSLRPVLWSQLDKFGEETQLLTLESLLTRSCSQIIPKVTQTELLSIHLSAIFGHMLSTMHQPMVSLSRITPTRSTSSSSTEDELESLFDHSSAE